MLSTGTRYKIPRRYKEFKYYGGSSSRIGVIADHGNRAIHTHLSSVTDVNQEFFEPARGLSRIIQLIELDHGRRIIGSDEREFLASCRDRGAGEHGNMATGALPVTWVFRIRGVIVDAKACVATRLVPYSMLFCLIAILEHPNGTIEGVVSWCGHHFGEMVQPRRTMQFAIASNPQ